MRYDVVSNVGDGDVSLQEQLQRTHTTDHSMVNDGTFT